MVHPARLIADACPPRILAKPRNRTAAGGNGENFGYACGAGDGDVLAGGQDGFGGDNIGIERAGFGSVNGGADRAISLKPIWVTGSKRPG